MDKENRPDMDPGGAAGDDTARILEDLQHFCENYIYCGKEKREWEDEEEGIGPALRKFTMLLSGIASCRKVPGIDGPVRLSQLVKCETEEKAAQAREHLRRMYGVTDAQSLAEVCAEMFRSGEEYGQFLSFWRGEPVFDESDLNEDGLRAFSTCKHYAGLFKSFVLDKGFFAWDCNERIGLCRIACACGIISEEEFFDLCLPLGRQAAAIYSSWDEYALSCLCGAVYFMFSQSGLSDKGLYGFYEINRRILSSLLEPDGFWERNPWLQIPEKKWAVPPSEIRELLTDWEEAEGCLATDRIMVDGCHVGYMYREEPNDSVPDSGWRFFAGDESDEYANDPDNVGVYHLNTLCNCDPDIIPLLHAPCGTAYYRDENGVFQREELILR